jgi:hypothetical protein
MSAEKQQGLHTLTNSVRQKWGQNSEFGAPIGPIARGCGTGPEDPFGSFPSVKFARTERAPLLSPLPGHLAPHALAHRHGLFHARRALLGDGTEHRMLAPEEALDASPRLVAVVARIGPGGRVDEVDAPSGAYAARYHGPGCAVTPIAPLPKLRAPVNLAEALAAACEGVVGISPAQFRAFLSPEDAADIEVGGIHPRTLGAYARSFAEGIRFGRIAALPGEEGGQAPTPLG